MKLPKIELTEPKTPEVDPKVAYQVGIIDQAGHLLGYSPSEPIVVQRAADEPPLHHTLRCAGIKPLCPKAVFWYKIRRQYLNVPATVLSLISKFKDDSGLSWFAGAVAMCSLLLVVYSLFNQHWAMASGGAAMLFVCIMVCTIANYESRITLGWKVFPIHLYKEPIPTDILALAIETKQRLPQVTINVEAFYRGFTSIGRDPETINKDPFLVAIYYGEHYYIGQWDEPGFRPVY